MIARVVFNLPLAGPFDYRIPPECAGRVHTGQRVAAPFGHRRLTGYVIGLARHSAIPAARLRAFTRLIDGHPWLDQELLDLASWLAGTYGVSMGEALATVLPVRMPPCMEPPPTTAQEAMRQHRHRVLLLEGQDQARAEVYTTHVNETLANHRSALWLVPELGMAMSLAARSAARWGERVAVLHGRTTARRRAALYARLQAGEPLLIVGTRSAVFAPLPKLGLIILDMEGDAGYKHPEMPAYHARAVAIERVRRHGALVVLGDAALSVETRHLAAAKRCEIVRLAPSGASSPHPPRIEIFDVRHQKRGWPVIFTVALEEAVRRTLERHGQVMLFLNRRGFATWVHCKRCKTVLRCPDCGTGLVYHFAGKELTCHTCQARQPAPEICPVCQERYLRYQGLGTEKVVSETCRLFPAARVARLDRDTAAGAQGVVDGIAAQLLRGEIDILVGTQLVQHLPAEARVPLVGVVSADTGLHVPDFRAGERTFTLLSALAARATERLLIQTALPDHEALRAVQRQEPGRFYKQELRARRALGLPPFRRLVRLVIVGTGTGPAESAVALSERLRKDVSSAIDIIGPAPSLEYRRRGRAAWQVLLKGRSAPSLLRLTRRAIGVQRRFEGSNVRVDVDPY